MTPRDPKASQKEDRTSNTWIAIGRESEVSYLMKLNFTDF